MGVCNRLLFCGRLQNAPTQHTSKMINYQSNTPPLHTRLHNFLQRDNLPLTHTPLRLLADFLQRGRYDVRAITIC